MNVVADTNVVVSGLLWRGTPHRIFTAAEAGRLILYTSPPLVDELRDVLARPRFAVYLKARHASAEDLAHSYLKLARLVVPARLPPVIHEDPEDDAVLACAVSARAHAIVTGDRHLLRLGSFLEMPIVQPTVFFSKIFTSSPPRA
jgi:putative PIN family toxin of toxin-antitoxin system